MNLRVVTVFFFCALLGALNTELAAKNYYTDLGSGSDANSGDSPTQAFKTLKPLSGICFSAGDTIYLAGGHTYNGTIELKGIRGSVPNPVVITSYGSIPATIDTKGHAAGISLTDCEHINICRLRLTGDGPEGSDDPALRAGMRCGIIVNVSRSGEYSGITLRDLLVEDLFCMEKGFIRDPKEVKTANGTQAYGWGIRFFNDRKDAVLKDILIEGCTVRNVSHTGIKFSGRDRNIQNIVIRNNAALRTGGPGMQSSGVRSLHLHHNVIDGSGSSDDSRKWGRGSGYWCFASSDILAEYNQFLNAYGPGDSAGAHIDYNCEDIVYQYNFSANNAGGFCEILGNNHNCSYRYNVSVNDGWRQMGVNGAFHQGKVLWLSGYVGEAPRNGPYNTYVYNNTIYVSDTIKTNIAVGNTSAGVLIANNIFCFSSAKSALGDQFNPEKREAGKMASNVVFRNNLYLNKKSWGKDIPVRDAAPVYGDPEFKNPCGMSPEDYIPLNKKLIKGRGIKIEPLPGDDKGLKTGLNVETDILGNRIDGSHGIGAINIR